MAKLISAKIDVSKITKDKLFQGEKGKYLSITIAVNDEVDQYGNSVSVQESQTQEERAANEPKNFLGNGKVFWSNEGGQQPAQQPTPQGQPAPADDDLPF